MHFFLGTLKVKVADIYKVRIPEMKWIESFCLLEIFACTLPSADILSKSSFLKNSFRNTSRVSKILDPDQD